MRRIVQIASTYKVKKGNQASQFLLNTKTNQMKKTILTLLAIAIVAITFSSCRTGYGCRGNQSWGRMIQRINSPY